MKLETIVEQLKEERFADYVALNPPISLEEILEAEKDLPFPLPAFYREFLQLANGGEIHGDRFFGIYPSGKPTADAYDLVEWNSKQENFEGVEQFFGNLIVVAGRDTGDLLVIRPNDETLYVSWHTDYSELDDEEYGSLLDVLTERLEWLEDDPVLTIWQKIGWWIRNL